MREKAQQEIVKILKDVTGSTTPYFTHYTYDEADEAEFDNSVVTKIEVIGKSDDIIDKLTDELYDIELDGKDILVKINHSVSQKFNPSGQNSRN